MADGIPERSPRFIRIRTAPDQEKSLKAYPAHPSEEYIMEVSPKIGGPHRFPPEESPGIRKDQEARTPISSGQNSRNWPAKLRLKTSRPQDRSQDQ